MTQPAITDLFGANSTYNSTDKTLSLPLTSLPALTNANPTPLEIYAALVSFAHNWISANSDQSVLADSTLTRYGEGQVATVGSGLVGKSWTTGIAQGGTIGEEYDPRRVVSRK